MLAQCNQIRVHNFMCIIIIINESPIGVENAYIAINICISHIIFRMGKNKKGKWETEQTKRENSIMSVFQVHWVQSHFDCTHVSFFSSFDFYRAIKIAFTITYFLATLSWPPWYMFGKTMHIHDNCIGFVEIRWLEAFSIR